MGSMMGTGVSGLGNPWGACHGDQFGAYHLALSYLVWACTSRWQFIGNHAYIRWLVGVLSGGWWVVE